jgi:hypothetical protein
MATARQERIKERASTLVRSSQITSQGLSRIVPGAKTARDASERESSPQNQRQAVEKPAVNPTLAEKRKARKSILQKHKDIKKGKEPKKYFVEDLTGVERVAHSHIQKIRFPWCKATTELQEEFIDTALHMVSHEMAISTSPNLDVAMQSVKEPFGELRGAFSKIFKKEYSLHPELGYGATDLKRVRNSLRAMNAQNAPHAGAGHDGGAMQRTHSAPPGMRSDHLYQHNGRREDEHEHHRQHQQYPPFASQPYAEEQYRSPGYQRPSVPQLRLSTSMYSLDAPHLQYPQGGLSPANKPSGASSNRFFRANR